MTGEGDPHEAEIPLEFSGETDRDGRHDNRIYENEYTIEVDHPDYKATTVEHTHDGDSELRVELETAADTAEITVTVVGPAGEPIEGASVTGEGAPGDAGIPLEFSGETDGDGEYTDVVYENNYRVEIDHPDYESRTIHFIHADGTDLSLTLDPL